MRVVNSKLGHYPLSRTAAEKALAAARRAVAAGDWDAAETALRAVMASDRIGPMRKAIPLAEQAARHRPSVRYDLGILLLNGLGLGHPPDVPRAWAIFRDLAMGDDTVLAGAAHAVLGSIAAGAHGGEPDRALALGHYEQGALLGSDEAAFNAGLAHHFGLGTAVDPERAGRFYRKAVAEGDREAMTHLAFLMIGFDVEGGVAEALSLLHAAADLGDDQAGDFIEAIGGRGREDLGAAAVLVAAISPPGADEDADEDEFSPGGI